MPERCQGRPSVCMAVYGDLTHDSRVRREAATLARSGWGVTVACLSNGRTEADLPAGVTILPLRPTASAVLPGTRNPFLMAPAGSAGNALHRLDWLRCYAMNLNAWGRSVVRVCADVDVWHLHDLPALAAIAPLVRRDVPVVYDAHELFLEHGTALRLPRFARAILGAIESRLIARAWTVVTVNAELELALRRRYRPRSVVVVHNCPWRWDPPHSASSLLADAAGIPCSSPVVLYHGALSRDRGIEQLMAALLEPGMERVHLVLLGYGECRDDYAAEARDDQWSGRVHVLDPVPPADLLRWVACADVGAMPIQPSTLNHRLSTPNKLFECLAAGVPVVASDFPGVRRIVLENPDGPLGELCDPTSTADVARALLAVLRLDRRESDALRSRCRAAATRRWNWETESSSLLNLYGALPMMGASERSAVLDVGGSSWHRIVARSMDVTIGTVALAGMAPVMAGVALAMRLSGDRGPLLFRARRVGEGGRVFELLKIRTMAPNSGGRGLTARDDPRVTRLGRLLRRSRIDELPQLINVLRGEMSLVGPRPEDPRYVDFTDPLHARVFTAKPGITGLAQLAFRDEAELLGGPDPERFYREVILPAKLRLDADYLDHRSIRLDLVILARTFATMIGMGPRPRAHSGY